MEKKQWVWAWAIITALAVVTAVAAVPGPVTAAPFDGQIDQNGALRQAVDWLVVVHQNDDGGYSSFSAGANLAPSDVGGTVDAVLAIAAAGENPAAPFPDRDNVPLNYLIARHTELTAFAEQDGSTAGKLVMALAAAGQDPRSFGGQDLVAVLAGHLAEDGSFGVPTAFGHSLAILGLAAVNEPVPTVAVDWLLAGQAAEGEWAGSWDDGFGTAGNPDATAMAIMALLASGTPVDDLAITAAVDFLRQSQQKGGGWAYGPGFEENANSTALVIQALSALGEDYYTLDGPWALESRPPLLALNAWRSSSGAFQADFGQGRFADFFSTVQAIPAIAGQHYPLPARTEAVRQAVGCLAALQDPLTGGWEEFAGGGVNAGGTSRAIQALAAAGEDPLAAPWQVGETGPLSALAAQTPDYLAAGRGGRAGVVLQGLAAVAQPADDFAGFNLVLSMTNYLSPTGEYDATNFGPFAHVEGMLGLLAAGQVVDETAVTFLQNAHTGGDWGGPDSTGIALQILGRLGEPVPEGTFAALHSAQLPDGGWGFDGASPNSTAEVAQGLAAVGANPFGPAWSIVVSGTVTSPAEAIMAQQQENGCWPNLFGPGDDPFATTDAILLLTLQPGWSLDADPTVPAPQPVLVDVPAEEPEAEPVTEPAPTEAPPVEPTAAPTGTPTPTKEAEVAPEVVDAPEPELIQSDDSGEEQATSDSLPYLLLGLTAVVIAGFFILAGRRRG